MEEETTTYSKPSFTNNKQQVLNNEKPTPIMEKYRRVVSNIKDDDEEIVRLYEVLLSELTFNSKPIITDLTVIAGEQKEHGAGIADAICARIVEVPVEQKLPSLYLLDSIVKNIGRDYVRHFSSRLPEVFCEAYRQLNPSLHPSMRHLFGTWATVFPSSVLRKIDTQLQLLQPINQQSSSWTPSRASESPRPSHGIHVNPKYLEARRQFESTSVDNELHHAKGSSRTNADEHLNGYGDYDVDHEDGTSLKIEAERLGATGSLAHTSIPLGAQRSRPSSTARLTRPSPPSKMGLDKSLPAVHELASDNSPSRFDYGRGRAIVRDKDANERWRKPSFDDNYQQLELPAAYSFSNGHAAQRTKALIDAYGNDRKDNRAWKDKPMNVGRFDINGIHHKVATKPWQNTEEEEYDWEDMSPTLAEHGRSNDFLPHPGGFRPNSASGVPPSSVLEPDFRRSSWSSQAHPPLMDSSAAASDAVPPFGLGRGLASQIQGFQNQRNQIMGSHGPQETRNMSRQVIQSSHLLNVKGSGRNFQISSSDITSSTGEKRPPFIANLPDFEAQVHGSSVAASRIGSSTFDSVNVETQSAAVPAQPGLWPSGNMYKPQPVHSYSVLQQQRQFRSRFNLMNGSDTTINQGSNKSLVLPKQELHSSENRIMHSTLPSQLPTQQSGIIPLAQPNYGQVLPQPQYFQSQEARENTGRSSMVPVSSHLGMQPLHPGYAPQEYRAASSTILPNSMPGGYMPIPVHNIPRSFVHSSGGAMPPRPPGPPLPSSHVIGISQNAGLVPNQAPGAAFSGLIGSLMAQGLISLSSNEGSAQDSIGIEFNQDILKVRHEPAIKALYADLPRQCTTCGLRFKDQEEHSSHMDWHVTKNRMNKNRKQKPSRKWFVSANMWLSGTEALGTEAAPGFLPTETIVEKKDDEEMAVPADENQSVCALCGEPFDDFYSDETEEWMYKGAVYSNAPSGSTIGLDRSQLGPIVHAKCRTETSVVSPDDFHRDEGGNIEEGSQRKRLRSL